MFMKLKKVLNEDETRRRQQLIKDAQAAQQALGPPPGMQPVLQLQPPISQQGTGRITLNKLPGHHPSLLPMVRDDRDRPCWQCLVRDTVCCHHSSLLIAVGVECC